MQAGKPNIIVKQVTAEEFNQALRSGDMISGQLKEDVLMVEVCKDRNEMNCNICFMRGDCPITLARELG